MRADQQLRKKTMRPNKNQIIANLAIKYASDAAQHFPKVDEGALKIQIAAGLLKAVQMPDVVNRLFTDDLADRLFPDGGDDPDDQAWDLV
jgi:hypothetical protein